MFEIVLFQTFYSFYKILLQIKKRQNMLSIAKIYNKSLSKIIKIAKIVICEKAWYKGFGDIYYQHDIFIYEGDNMENIREFYGDTVIDESDYNEFDGEFKIELAYYKTRELEKMNDKRFGIEIVKKEIDGIKTKVEMKEFSGIVDTEEKVDSILEILRRNKVTPVAVCDVLEDMKVLWVTG